MTIKQARKLLGKEAQTLTDDELKLEIQLATFLKDIFLDELTKSRK